MLATQVQYWNLRELSRHNQATEGIAQQQNNESIRHNLMSEKFTNRQLNLQQEANTNNFRAITENIRHNKASEGISWFNSFETKRHNLAGERNTAQQNYVNYLNAQAQLRNAETQKYNADTNRFAAKSNAAIGMRNAETNRYNAATQAKLVESTRQLNSARVNKMGHDITQGYINLAVNGVIGGVNAASNLMRSTFPWANLR